MISPKERTDEKAKQRRQSDWQAGRAGLPASELTVTTDAGLEMVRAITAIAEKHAWDNATLAVFLIETAAIIATEEDCSRFTFVRASDKAFGVAEASLRNERANNGH